MKGKCCSLLGCLYSPACGLGLLRVVLAAFFIYAGAMKAMDADSFKQMLEGVLGMKGMMIDLSYWLVVIFELGGGIVLLLGKLLPKMIYDVALIGLLIVMLVALLMVHIPGGDMMMIPFQILITTCVVTLMCTKPMCPCGITGCSGCDK